jgi:hypothetical protein
VVCVAVRPAPGAPGSYAHRATGSCAMQRPDSRILGLLRCGVIAAVGAPAQHQLMQDGVPGVVVCAGLGGGVVPSAVVVGALLDAVTWRPSVPRVRVT